MGDAIYFQGGILIVAHGPPPPNAPATVQKLSARVISVVISHFLR